MIGTREPLARKSALVLGFGLVLFGVQVSCEKPQPQLPGDEGPDEPELSNQSAARPALAVRAHFAIDCFDVYAECKAVRHLPAVSADGTRIALADTRDEDARDEFVLTLVYLDSATGAELSRVPIMTLGDRARGLHPDTEAMSPALRATLEKRVAAADQELTRAGFQPLLFLGTVDEERPGKPVAGLRATFDGTHVVVDDGDKQLWRRAVRPVLTDAGVAGCSSAQIAELGVWVRRAPRTLLARVSFTTAHMCDVSSQYQAWR